MDAVAAIRKLGFRRWYERQLIVGHAWLAGCFLSIVLAAAGLELLTLGRGVAEFLFDASLICGAFAFGWLSWRRYAARMVCAEIIGGQAVCPGCSHYGFRIDPARGGGSVPGRPPTIPARCPKCAHTWPITPPPATAPPPDPSGQDNRC
jgi:hypothetical protein